MTASNRTTAGSETATRRGEGTTRAAVELPTRSPDDRRAPKGARLVGGRYALIDRLGAGASAEVWRALDEREGTEVAVKLLHPYLLSDELSRSRFESEARAAQRLRHPGVVAIRDVVLADDEAAIIMDLVPGGTLAERLAREGRIPEREAASIAADLAGALGEAHRLGIVHRDVKPGNVLLGADGRPRLADFGIARSLDDSAGLTVSGTVMGSLRYMAPEQLAGEPPGPAADVFALGAVLYEMLAARPAFDARNPAALIEQQRHAPPGIDGVDRRLTAVALAALGRANERRITTASDMESSLRDWLRDGRQLAPAALPGAMASEGRGARASSLGPRPAPVRGRPAPGGPRRRVAGAVAAVGLAAAVAAIIVGWAALSPDGQRQGAGVLGAGVTSASPQGLATPLPSNAAPPTASPRAVVTVAKPGPRPAGPAHRHKHGGGKG